MHARTAEEASSSPSSKKTVEVTSASENFRHKKDTKAPVVTTIVRRPDQIASDEAAKLRDETSELAAIKIEGGIGAATDSYFQPYSANVYNNLNTIVRAARSCVRCDACSLLFVSAFNSLSSLLLLFVVVVCCVELCCFQNQCQHVDDRVCAHWLERRRQVVAHRIAHR